MMNCVICAIAKLENDYLYEWASYHIGLGFSHIYLYDNNDMDGENPMDVFVATPLQDKVTIMDVRGKKYWQLRAYQHCTETYPFDWCAYIDIDEFITFAENSGIGSIEDYLGRFPQTVHAVHLNWLCYGDCGHVRKQKQVLMHYSTPLKPLDFCFTYDDIAENTHIKSIVRGGILCDWLHNPVHGQITPHTPFVRGVVANAGGVIANEPFADMDYTTVFIRHYTTKSLEDYYTKIHRQAADYDGEVYSIAKYFRINRLTLRKLLYIRSRGSIPLKRILYEWLKYRVINYRLPLGFLIKSMPKQRKKQYDLY